MTAKARKENATDQVVSAVLAASRVLVAVSARSLAKVEEPLTLTQFRTLVVLSSGGPTNLNRLADTLGVNSSTALRTVDRLVVAGLASRAENSENRREVVLSLTEGGHDVVRDVTARRRREISRILSRMPSREREELVSAFQAFATAAGEPSSGPAPTSPVW